MIHAIFAYPGLGKTTLCLSNDRFSDIETRLFKDMNLKEFICTRDYPNYRGTHLGNINLEFPNNLNKYAKAQLDDGKILLFGAKTRWI